MSDLVGNPEDPFSQNEAHLKDKLKVMLKVKRIVIQKYKQSTKAKEKKMCGSGYLTVPKQKQKYFVLF